MGLDIGEALRDGADRVTARNGLVLMGVFVAVGVASTVVTQTLTDQLARTMAEFARQQGEPFDPSRLGPTPLSVPLPVSVTLVLALGLALLVEALHIVAIRTFVSDARRSIPAAFVRRHIAWVTLNGFVGGIVVAALVLVGLVFLVVPGLFLYVAFFFVRQHIAVEDVTFVDAMAESWSLTAGERVEVFVLAVVLVLVEVVAGIPSLLLQPVDPAVAALVATLASAVAGVFVIGVGARAYAQLRADERRATGHGGTAGSDTNGDVGSEDVDDDEDEDEDPYAGALGPDDLEPP